MKNYEKYAEEIKNYEGTTFCIDFVIPNILKESDCSGSCNQCRLLQTMWLFEEYKEPEVDWNQVAVDTPILVKGLGIEDPWQPRHFAKYKDGKVYAWIGGCTSWSTTDDNVSFWAFAKLAETKKGE